MTLIQAHYGSNAGLKPEWSVRSP